MNLKTTFLSLLFIFFTINLLAQAASAAPTSIEKTEAYKSGEYLKYRIHFGFLNAGYATIKLKNSTQNGVDVFHAYGHGWTTGAAKLFYVVDDVYESYFTKGQVKPVLFKRRVDEDGYLIQRDLTFDHKNEKVKVEDFIKNTTETYTIKDVQDMISAMYYLRSIDITTIEEGDEVEVKLFFDGESFPFRLRFDDKETINTKFGKVKTWRVQPMVQKGRVFENEESVTLWVTDDANKLPIRIKASLVVGSLKADLEVYRGLANSFPIVMD